MASYINDCFWVYPTPGTIAPGTPLTFQVVVPPSNVAILPGTTPTVETVFPVSGSAVSWVLTDVGTSSPLEEGEDYRILEGSLSSPLLSVVFKPRDRVVSVVPKLTLFHAPSLPATPENPEVSSWPGEQYTLTAPSGTATVESLLMDALTLTARANIIEPGVPATLQVVPRSPTDIPQVVTQILHEQPTVQIRGAIPLGDVIDAVMGPIGGLLGAVTPSAKATFDSGEQDVKKLLADALSLPIAVNVEGQRIVQTLVPSGVPTIAMLSQGAPGSDTISGIVPIGQWQSKVATTAVDWTLMQPAMSAPHQDLSPGINLLKSFLLLPDFIDLVQPQAPTPVTATAQVTFSIDPEIFGASTLSVTLPPLALLRVPLPIPRVGAVFKFSFDDVANAPSQIAYVVTDSTTGAAIPSLDDLLQLLRRLAGTLNAFAALADLSQPGFSDITRYSLTVSVLLNQLGHIRVPDGITYRPIWEDSSGAFPTITIGDDDDDDDDHPTWNNAIAAIVSIGLPADERLGIPYFLVSDSDSPHWIRCNGSGFLPNLNDNFSNVVQVPITTPAYAIANNPAEKQYHILERLGFVFQP